VLFEMPNCGLTVTPAQGIEHLGVLTGGWADPAGLTHVSMEVSPGSLSEGGDHLEQSRVGATLQENPVPIVMEVDRGSQISAGGFHPAIEGS